jgi:hypothetical protein
MTLWPRFLGLGLGGLAVRENLKSGILQVKSRLGLKTKLETKLEWGGMIQDQRATRVRGRQESRRGRECGRGRAVEGVCRAELALSNDAGQHESKEG